MDETRFQCAIAAIDAANAADPNQEVVDGRAVPKELLYGERMSAMLERFAPGASEAVRLAVRCQHIRRWEIPRSNYPQTPAGYKQWRTELMKFHGETAAAILWKVGYDAPTIGRVQSLLRKEGLKVNADTQLLEDVVALVFLESYLDDFARRHDRYDEEKLVDILRKTWRKMSAAGREAALTRITLPPALKPVVLTAAGADRED